MTRYFYADFLAFVFICVPVCFIILLFLQTISLYLELQTLIQKEIQAAVPCTPNSRPMSPPVDVCAPCAANQRRTGQATVKSISLCTINLQSDIKLLPIKRQRNLDTIKSRVFVMPSPNSTRAPSKNSNFHGYENSSLMNTSFDDDSDRDTLHGMLPMFPSPSDASIFQTSPPSEITKLLSPPYQANAPMPSLSPFQPIPNKQMFMASPTKNVQISDSSEYKGRLAIGFLLSGTAVEADTESNGTPQVIKVCILFFRPTYLVFCHLLFLLVRT